MTTIDQVDFSYNGSPLFHQLNLTLEKGNIYGLLGLNGAGKTTLMKLLTGLLTPTGGALTVLGEKPASRNPSFLSQVFVLPEELNIPSITEKEFLATRAPFYPRFDRDLFERCMTAFDSPRGRRLNKLSYGQKKKFLLSFGLACGSELLILDEPTNGLDIPSKGLFRRLVAEGLTEDRIFVLSTHQVRDVESLIDPIIILHEGQVLYSQTMEEISQSLHMTRTSMAPSPQEEGLLYTEAVVGGHWSVWEGADEEGGPVDLEVLFNAVISGISQSHSWLEGKGGEA
ncbi:MAG: ABC transporter ATP-binding protein [Spirochaetales bacterium]|nr:ABC transporter ATP-binding protein [Spirochaetales bacterium]